MALGKGREADEKCMSDLAISLSRLDHARKATDTGEDKEGRKNM